MKEIVFKEVGNWKASVGHKTLGYSIRNSRDRIVALFWPNDNCSVGEIIYVYPGDVSKMTMDKSGMLYPHETKVEKSGWFFPYNDNGLLQAVRYCYLSKQKPNTNKLLSLWRKIFS